MGAPASADPDNWSGLYLGLHAGGVWADTDGLYDNGGSPGPVDLSQLDSESGIVGGQIGYNLQAGVFVVGVEGDASATLFDNDDLTFASGGARTVLSGELDELYSIRGRLGVATGNLLLFGTAGWGHAEYEFGAVQTPKFAPGPNGSKTFDGSGAVYGGGAEYAFGNLRLGVQYLRYDTGFRHNFGAAELVDTDVGDFIEVDDIDVVRAVLNFRLDQ